MRTRKKDVGPWILSLGISMGKEKSKPDQQAHEGQKKELIDLDRSVWSFQRFYYATTNTQTTIFEQT